MKKLITTALLLLIFLAGQGQKTDLEFIDGREEIYFSFSRKEVADLQEVSKTIYIDRIAGDTVFAYANQKQFSLFKDLDISYTTEIPPSMIFGHPVMRDQLDIKDLHDWDFYPTYNAYVNMMEQFAENYPDICELVEIGTLSSGRKILALRISDNVQLHEAEPEFLYTSGIHGDETTGYVLLLRLADYLLGNYGSNDKVTELVQSTDLYLNPLANPDGTFAAGNNTVFGATRTNANGIDINRNFPDPEDGPHPDGNAWQEETVLFMNFAESHNFVMSANIHGGAEVCNYPWDTWSKRHADEKWWQYVCREYADTAQSYSPPGYLDAYNNGITNGYDWYSIDGGRQDYMNYFQQCREFTLEISTVKTPPASSLPDYWEYNFRSLLNYIQQVNYGLQGMITDSQTAEPLRAKVEFLEHDKDSSLIFSESLYGLYHRPAKSGIYDIKFSAPGYIPKYLGNVSIIDREKTILDISLQQAEFYADFTAGENIDETGSYIPFTDLSYGNPQDFRWVFEGGIPHSSDMQNPSVKYSAPGVYDVQLTVYKDGDSSTLLLEDYIKIDEFHLMSSETIESCSGYFFDPGGRNNNYNNSDDLVMHFFPEDPAKRLVFVFSDFSVEFDDNCGYDWLKIYNGSSVNDELKGTYCGSDVPDTIVADNPEGALTFEFHSDFSENREGWMAKFFCDSNVSVAENTVFKQQELFYPNPAKENLIYLKSARTVENVQIFDINGSVVLNTGLNNNVIDISSLEKGIYVIRISTDERIFSSKLIRF